jgi:AraC-like DNA-binding protein
LKQATRFSVQLSWKILINDMGYNPDEVLRLAQLPADLFNRPEASISSHEYFNFWRSLEQIAGTQELALQLGQVISVEAFDPVLFACLCSPNLNIALQRIAQYKRLIGPLLMDVEISQFKTTVRLNCYATEQLMPRSLSLAELVFFTQLSRIATRQVIVPIQASCKELPQYKKPYDVYFGCPLTASDQIEISFSASDALRPFLTHNTGMWQVFETHLQKRLSVLDDEASMTERVRGVLLETLPAGMSSIEIVAQRLALSKRTLQRHLSEENVSYQEVLDQVRSELAQHYLTHSSISTGEISWLLGFQESNSFIRAFKNWTGKTPNAFRLTS